MEIEKFDYKLLTKNKISPVQLVHGFQDGRPVIVTDCDLAQKLIDRNYANLKQTFEIPKQTLIEKYETERFGFLRGYLRYSKDERSSSSQAKEKTTWQIGADRNVFPSEVPDLVSSAINLYAQLETISIKLMNVIATYFHQDAFITSLIHDPTEHHSPHVMWFNYYPPIKFESGSAPLRINAHNDVSLISVVVSPTTSGLEVGCNNDGSGYFPVDSKKGDLIILAGELLEQMTNGLIPATRHRVAGDEVSSRITRMSIVFFLSTYRHKPIHSFSGEHLYDQGGALFFERLKKIGVVPPEISFQQFLELNKNKKENSHAYQAGKLGRCWQNMPACK